MRAGPNRTKCSSNYSSLVVRVDRDFHDFFVSPPNNSTVFRTRAGSDGSRAPMTRRNRPISRRASAWQQLIAVAYRFCGERYGTKAVYDIFRGDILWAVPPA